jgi:hypothetical protein
VAASALAAPTTFPYPNSIAAIGGTLTLDDPTNPNPPDSWSTGTNPAVDSHYLRILAANPAIKGKNYNFSTQEIDVAAEARQAVARRVEYVTVAAPEFDLCGGASAAQVGARLAAALRILAAGLPNARVLVTSARDAARLLRVLNQNTDLRGITVCGTQVGASPPVLTRLHQRFTAANSALARVCARYRQCRFDGNAVFEMPLALADISPIDNFSPSVNGQRKLAEVTWKATFPFGR